MKEDPNECVFDEQEIQKCPFLRFINKPMNPSIPHSESRGPIFQDGSDFDLSFKLFHCKNGLDPLWNRSATISFSAFGSGGPFSFDAFHEKCKNKKKKSDPSKKKHHLSRGETLNNEWLQIGNCPITTSYRALNNALPLVAKAFESPKGMKFRCPAAVIAARSALSKTEVAKTLRPRPLPAKMIAIAAMGMTVNFPFGVWREHTRKFSPSWFLAVHASVPFIAMLRKAILMPKAAMVLTIAASILGQSLGAKAERIRIKAIAEKKM